MRKKAINIKPNVPTINEIFRQGYNKVAKEKITTSSRAKYAAPATVNYGNVGLVRTSQLVNNNMVTPPNYYTPFTTLQAFQIPNNRKEVYLWAQWWYDNEPKVAAAIEFYSDFPLSGFELECPNTFVKKYFEKLIDKLNFDRILPLISQEYFLRGDAFPFASIDCEHCQGLMIDNETGEPCKHENATWKSITLYNPESIEVTLTFGNEEPLYYLNIDDNMVKLVQEKKPYEIYQKIPDHIKQKILAREPILLDPLCIYHLKKGAAPWQPYGTSMLRRLFPALAYKDKVRQANWMVAERMILPIKIVKIGSDERPASEEDIQAVQEELAAVANDPLLTLVTHNNFDLEFYGACYSEDTEVLTNNGFKKYYEVNEQDLIACYNPNNNNLEFHNYIEKQIYEYDSNKFGKLIHFNNKNCDVLVTNNHNMWVKRNHWNKDTNRFEFFKWQKIPASEIRNNDKFLSYMKWEGVIPQELPYKKYDKDNKISLEEYLNIISYIIVNKYSKKYNYLINTELYQYILQECHNENEQFCLPQWILNLPLKYLNILINNLMNNYNTLYDNFKITQKKYKFNTPYKLIADNIQEILLKLGYTSIINENNSSYTIYWNDKITEYYTIKEHDINYEYYNGKVWCLTVPTGIFITRRNGKIGIHGNSGKILQVNTEIEEINKELMDGLMLNTSVLNGEGVSYANAQVGLLTMSRRLERFRREVKYWIEERLFKQVAIWNGFTTEGKMGEEEYIYPRIKWADLELRDNSQKLQILMQAQQQGIVSSQTLIEAFGLDYDQEVERLRFEQSVNFINSPDVIGNLTNTGMGSGYAGDLGAMGGMGGAGLEGVGGGSMGTTPGGETGGGAMPEMPMASSKGSEELYRKASSIMNELYNTKMEQHNNNIQTRIANKQVKGKAHLEFLKSLAPVTGRGYTGSIPDEPDFIISEDWQYPIDGGEQAVKLELDAYGKVKMIRTANKKQPIVPKMLFSKLEQQLYNIILNLNIPIPFYAQYKVGPTVRFQLDGAFPTIKLGVEADSETFHASPEKIAQDKQRDAILASQGWTILRFKEDEIEQQPAEVGNVILNTIRKLINH